MACVYWFMPAWEKKAHPLLTSFTTLPLALIQHCMEAIWEEQNTNDCAHSPVTVTSADHSLLFLWHSACKNAATSLTHSTNLMAQILQAFLTWRSLWNISLREFYSLIPSHDLCGWTELGSFARKERRQPSVEWAPYRQMDGRWQNLMMHLG